MILSTSVVARFYRTQHARGEIGPPARVAVRSGTPTGLRPPAAGAASSRQELVPGAANLVMSPSRVGSPPQETLVNNIPVRQDPFHSAHAICGFMEGGTADDIG